MLEAALHDSPSGTWPTHRISAPSPALRGRVVVAAVAVGAAVTAGQTIENTAAAMPEDPTLLTATRAVNSVTSMGGRSPAPEYLAVSQPPDSAAAEAVQAEDVQAMAKGERFVAERAAQEAEAQRPRFALPARGTFTSGYGGRWGTIHWGIDIANSIGTPIFAAADGVVVESGPASGFGLWVRLKHDDGTYTIYGHINRSLVSQGERVRAGDEIAEMGNRGHSTGPHLHFEVWTADNQKINPLTWLLNHGLSL